jgi:glycerol-3-phosphate dehydrogenase
VFSRGVSLALPRDPQHTRHLVVDSRIGDALTLAPWGPVSLWASTDTAHRDLAESWRHTPADVETLLDEYNRHFQPTRTVRDVLSVRVGVRALPVARTAAVTDTRGLTRHHRIHHHRDRAWVTIYGGQLSGCLGLADQVTAEVTRALDAVPARGEHPAHHRSRLLVAPDRMSFPGLASPVVTPTWAAAHEHCRTLDDYVRRRTNIAQWVPGGGFGRRGEHADLLYRIALQISGGDHSQATQQWMRHRRDTLAALPATDLQLPASPSSLISQE